MAPKTSDPLSVFASSVRMQRCSPILRKVFGALGVHGKAAYEFAGFMQNVLTRLQRVEGLPFEVTCKRCIRGVGGRLSSAMICPCQSFAMVRSGSVSTLQVGLAFMAPRCAFAEYKSISWVCRPLSLRLRRLAGGLCLPLLRGLLLFSYCCLFAFNSPGYSQIFAITSWQPVVVPPSLVSPLLLQHLEKMTSPLEAAWIAVLNQVMWQHARPRQGV